jgi:two-component system, NarL family, nitrate/nitrite response regulator NarL
LGPEDKRIKVVLADDHPVYREGIARLIRQRQEFELVAECRNGDEALAAIRTSRPDIALLDIRLPGLSGTDVLRQLQGNGESTTRVVMLTASEDGATIYESIASGASGYLLKDAERAEICDALLAVAAGRTVLPAGVHTGLMGEIRHQAEPRAPALSPREQEVLRSAARGRSAREIADELFVSTATVKTHLQHIYEKLGVSGRASAVVEGMRRGMVE